MLRDVEAYALFARRGAQRRDEGQRLENDFRTHAAGITCSRHLPEPLEA